MTCSLTPVIRTPTSRPWHEGDERVFMVDGSTVRSVSGVQRGRLGDASAAPAVGEAIEQLVALGPTRVEHILSGRLEDAVAYDQDHDEWVLVLEGSADLEVDGAAVTLTAGDWLLLPRRVPHRLLRTTPGTRWLAVHAGAQ